MSTGFFKAAALAATLMVPAQSVFANESEIFVNQVSQADQHRAMSGSGQSGVTQNQAPQGNIANLQRFDLLGTTPNGLVVDQSGHNNSATVDVVGLMNSTYLKQRGALNSASVDVVGDHNNILVDQRGVRLESDINVTDGANKTVLHLQRGRGNILNSDPIDLSGTDAQRIIVVDTTRGRRIVEK